MPGGMPAEYLLNSQWNIEMLSRMLSENVY